MRVLVANQPRAYRDVISGALQALRPDLDVATADPGDLDEEVRRLSPYLVICSRVTGAVDSLAPAWIELYPGHSAGAVVRLREEPYAVPEMDFETLLSTVDRAWLLCQLA